MAKRKASKPKNVQKEDLLPAGNKKDFFISTKTSLLFSKNVYKKKRKNGKFDISSKEKPAEKILEKKEAIKTKRKRILSLVSFLINIGVLAGIFIYSALTEQMVDIVAFFAFAPYYRFFFIAIAIIVVMNLLDTVKISLLSKQSTGYFRPRTSYKMVALGKYYDSITPLSLGGEPFQAYYLSKRGFPGEKATGITAARHIFLQFTFVVSALVVLVYVSITAGGQMNFFVTLAAWLGLGFQSIILIVYILLTFSKKIGPAIVIFFLKIANKLKIIKNYQTTFRHLIIFVKGMQQTMKEFAKNKWLVFGQIVLVIGTTVLNVSIPYCIYLAFNYHTILVDPSTMVGWFEFCTMFIMCELAVSFIPIPGGAGAAELSFATVFAAMFPQNTIVWALLLWRIGSYYIYIAQGAIILTYDHFWGNKKMERLLKENKYPHRK